MKWMTMFVLKSPLRERDLCMHVDIFPIGQYELLDAWLHKLHTETKATLS